MARLPLPGRGTGPRVVALGGGHGLAASLAALRLVVEDITAIVTVADNGGSSGRLRRDFDVLPPGDLRMALAALCDDSEWGHIWRDVLQHRFVGDGDLSGHALGNLLIVTLWQQHSDPVRGLDLVARLLGARGRVLPMASTPLQMRARVRGDDPARPDEVTEVAGQVEVARTPGLVESVAVEPADPEIPAETLAAIEGATASALNDVWGLGLDRVALAQAGRRAENEAVGAPTGIMDQMASMLGQSDAAIFLDCRTLDAEVTSLGFAAAGLEVLVVDTLVTHAHSTGGYRERRTSCERGAAAKMFCWATSPAPPENQATKPSMPARTTPCWSTSDTTSPPPAASTGRRC